MLKGWVKVICFFSLMGLPFISIAKRNYGRKLCSTPGYHCIQVKAGDTWPILFPNENKRDVVMRLNRTNMVLKRGMVLAVPDNLAFLDHMSISPMPERIEPQGQNLLIIDLGVQAFGAYSQDGFLMHWGPISGGQNWCSDVGRPCRTVRGHFFVYTKGGSQCVSSKYPIGVGGAPMPFCMFFYKGYAMHASFLPGYHASHGCVRLFYEDAKWLNKNFIRMGRKGTKVIIQSFLQMPRFFIDKTLSINNKKLMRP
jgi:hypothetical protein